jgi:hypothetical protein
MVVKNPEQLDKAAYDRWYAQMVDTHAGDEIHHSREARDSVGKMKRGKIDEYGMDYVEEKGGKRKP